MTSTCHRRCSRSACVCIVKDPRSRPAVQSAMSRKCAPSRGRNSWCTAASRVGESARRTAGSRRRRAHSRARRFVLSLTTSVSAIVVRMRSWEKPPSTDDAPAARVERAGARRTRRAADPSRTTRIDVARPGRPTTAEPCAPSHIASGRPPGATSPPAVRQRPGAPRAGRRPAVRQDARTARRQSPRSGRCERAAIRQACLDRRTGSSRPLASAPGGVGREH